MIADDRFPMGPLVFAVAMIFVAAVDPRPATQRLSADEPAAEKAEGAPARSLRTGDPHAHGITDAGLESLRAVLREGVEDRVVPGVSLLLAHRGEVVFKEAFGNLTLDHKAQMASSSKPVTATLLMILVDHFVLTANPLVPYTYVSCFWTATET